jgi:hypothetical protein
MLFLGIVSAIVKARVAWFNGIVYAFRVKGFEIEYSQALKKEKNSKKTFRRN